jgi:hypothetical protein
MVGWQDKVANVGLVPHCRYPAGGNVALSMNGSNGKAALQHGAGMAKSAMGRNYPWAGLN